MCACGRSRNRSVTERNRQMYEYVRACGRAGVCACVHASTCIILLALRERILAVYKLVKLLTIMDKPQSFAVCLPVCLCVCPAIHTYVCVCVFLPVSVCTSACPHQLGQCCSPQNVPLSFLCLLLLLLVSCV